MKRGIQPVDILAATEEKKCWSARLFSGSEPWITLKFSYDKCLKSCQDPEFRLYVAHWGDEPCGAILMDPRGVAGSPYIKSLAISPEHRGYGIGKKMMDFAENFFRPESRHIFLCVSSFNHRARIFYERLGYRETGEFKDYIIEGASEILMYKRIS